MALLGLSKAAFVRQRSLYIAWTLSLTLAVTGLVIIDVYRQSLNGMIRDQGRQILTADITLSARRKLTEDEKNIFRSALPAATQFSELTELMAMVSSDKNSRLANLRFVDEHYPLVGELYTDAPSAKTTETTDAWADRDLLALLPSQVGQNLRVGEVNVRITGAIRKDSSQTFRFGSLSPRLYVRQEILNASRLVQFGSTFTNTVLARTQKPLTQRDRQEIERRFSDPGIQIMVPEDLEQGSLRVLSRLLDFLGLIGLVTLCLGWLGVYYLGRRWLVLERPSTATLKAMGFSSQDILRLLVFKLLAILIIGSALGGALSWWAAKASLPMVQTSLPAEFHLLWSWPNTLLLLLIGPLAGTMLLYEPIYQTATETPLMLFNPERSRLITNWKMVATLALSISLLFGLLTLLQARSWQVSGFFLATLLAALLLIGGLAYLGLGVVQRLRPRLPSWSWHLATAQWLRRPATSILLVTVSALSGLLAQLVPHLEKTFVSELNPAQRTSRPALFMFDVQDEQKDPLSLFLQDKGIKISQSCPFIRARILKVNDSPFERGQSTKWSTREQELEARFRNRGVNLTYRQSLSPHERIISGKSWDKTHEGEISVEQDYAARLGFKLGDRLLFDIQGTEVSAQITSLREVHWDSFEPAFFIQFPDGVLNEAPKTWVMTALPNQQFPTHEVQRMIGQQFANVSSVHVEEAVENLMDLVGKLSLGLKLASRLAMALGVFVFVMVITLQLLSARSDIWLLSTQGLSHFDIWRLNLIVYGLLALLGVTLGGLFSMAVNWGIAHFAFHSPPEFDFGIMLQTAVILMTLCLLGLTWAGRQVR